jgi:hypothetical protein
MSTGSLESRIERIARTAWRTRRRFMATVLAAGLVLAATVAAAWVLGGVVLDLAVPLAVPARVAVWCGWWGVVALAIAAFLVLPTIRRPLVQAIALRIERSLGGMHNRLLTVVDLAGSRHGSRFSAGTPAPKMPSPTMVERLLDQTQERLSDFRTSRVVPWRIVLRNLGIAGLVAVCLIGLSLGLGERFGVTLLRLMRPTADIPPATWLEVQGEGDLDVLAREPFTIEARITRGEASAADLVLIDSRGRESRQPMHPPAAAKGPRGSSADSGAGAGGLFVATLDGLESPHRYRIEAGNTWTRTHEIRLLPRPEVVSVERRIRLPAYMRRDAPLPVEPDATRIEAPEGSTVEFVAAVSGWPVEGRLDLFDRAPTERSVERFDERIWFEDDLPRDAVTETAWRWTTAQAAGGVRSFTFGYDGRPFAMRTRLEPLVLPKEQTPDRSIQVMARFDPPAAGGGSSRGPQALSMLLEYEGGRTEIVWGNAEAIPPAPAASRFLAGPLGEPGGWMRCLAPLARLPQLAGRSVQSVTFSIDSGRVLLDRPGWVERSREAVLTATDFPTASNPFVSTAEQASAAQPGNTAQQASAAQPGNTSQQASVAQPGTLPAVEGIEAPQAWQAALAVLRPTFAGITFENRLGHPSLPVAAVEIVPTRDRAPSLHIDLPPESLTLAVTDDVPLSAQAFDDWGIAAVLIRVGPEPSSLGAPRPLDGVALSERPPQTRVPIDTLLSAELLGLAAGRSAAWQLEVHDTKGQVAYGPIHRVTVVMPPEHALAKTQVPALAEAMREAMQAAREAAQKAESIDQKREAVLEAVGEKTLDALDAAEEAHATAEAARTPEDKADESLAAAAENMTDEAQAAADAAVTALEPERKQDLEAVDAFLEKQRKQAERVAKAAEKAAAQAASSELVPQSSKADLDRLAEKAREAERALRPDERFEGSAAKLDRADDAGPVTELAKAADDLARALAEASDRLDAAGAAMQLESLADDLERRAEALAAPARRPDAATPGQTPPPPSGGQPIGTPPAPQQQVRQQIRDLEQILGRSIEEMLAEMSEHALAERPKPASADSSPQDPAAAAPKTPAAAAGQTAPDAEQSPSKPVKAPPADAPAADTPAGDAPVRPMPEEGQPPRGDGRSDSSATAPTDPPAAAAMAGKAAADAAASKPQGDADSSADATDAAPDPAARAALAAERVADEVAALAERLTGDTRQPAPADDPTESAEVREALAMAERARRLQARSARESQQAAARAEALARQAESQAASQGTPAGDDPADPAAEADPSGKTSDGGSLAGRVDPLPADALRGLSPAERAAIERLPPRVRDTLLDGMRARGPSAYRDVIDAYFRHLGREMPK